MVGIEKISVVMPAYNCGEFILQSINSVLCQTHRNFELLIYDDGSTDKTADIVKEVKDSRVRIFQSTANHGVAYARNKLLSFTTGQYIVNQDADDISYPDRFEKMLKFLQKNDLVLTCCSNQVMFSNVVFTFETDKFAAITRQYNIEKAFAGNNCMFDRCILDSGIKYNELLKHGEDVLFEAEIQARFPGRMQAMPDILLLYRKHGSSLTTRYKQDKESLVSKELMEERNKKIKNLLQSLQPLSAKDI